MPFVKNSRHTDKTKEKLREAWKRRRLTPVSADTRTKMSHAHMGMKFSDQHRIKLSLALIGKNTWSRGRSHTENARLKISVAKRGVAKPYLTGPNNPRWIDGRSSDREFIRTKNKLAKAHRRALGKLTRSMWNGIKALYGHTCPACGLKKSLTMDHIVPVSLGGTNDPMNIQPLCASCNSRKGTRILRYDIA